mgnify:CR=1 FL=1
MLRTTLSHFPEGPVAKEDAGVPFGCVAQPLAPIEKHDAHALPAAEHAERCDSCYAYISPFCTFMRNSWKCAMCGAHSKSTERFRPSQGRRDHPELVRSCVEYEYAASVGESAKGLPSCIALVDVSADASFIEVAQAGLLAALRALDPDSLFAMVARRVSNLSPRSPTSAHVSPPSCDLSPSTPPSAGRLLRHAWGLSARIQRAARAAHPHPGARASRLAHLRRSSSAPHVRPYRLLSRSHHGGHWLPPQARHARVPPLGTPMLI